MGTTRARARQDRARNATVTRAAAAVKRAATILVFITWSSLILDLSPQQLPHIDVVKG